jgi:hypothetical protein
MRRRGSLQLLLCCFILGVVRHLYLAEGAIDRVRRTGDVTAPVDPPQLTDDLLDHFIVIPEAKLLFCYVEKVGCTMFNNLFRQLRLALVPDEEEREWLSEQPWWRNTPEHHGLTRKDLEYLLVDPEWTKSVFYRDPLTRFLSGYRSKCERGHDRDTVHCRNEFGVLHASFSEAISQMQSADHDKTHDVHWNLASNFCGGLGATLDYYDIVHELDPETAPVLVGHMLIQAGVGPGLVSKLVEGTFEQEPGSPPKHKTNANAALCRYFDTEDKIKIVRDFYQADYEAFGMEHRLVEC